MAEEQVRESGTTTTVTTVTTTVLRTTSPVRTGTVYEIVNTVNGLRYIGSTSLPLQKRLSSHKSDSKNLKKTSDFHVAMRTIGASHFSINPLAIVEYVDEKDLKRREFETISKYDKDELYNMDLVFGTLGEKHRAKLVANHVGMSGKVHTPESKEKMVEAKQKGGCFSFDENEHRIRYRYTKDGKKMSKSFSYGSHSHITQEQAMVLAKAYQCETFPELFSESESESES